MHIFMDFAHFSKATNNKDAHEIYDYTERICFDKE